MRQKSLFKAEHRLQKLEVDLRREEPVVWVQRLVILSEANPKALLQDIPFHRGLNIIRTKRRNREDTRSAAHDAGKTLLMRLLRFTLGEGCFGSRDTVVRVRKARANSVVIAEWIVGHHLWTVVRPLSDRDGQHSFVVRGQDWKSALADDSKREPLSAFIQRIEDASFSELPPLHHINGGHPGWNDVLAWIARDSECGFRKPDTWRDKEVNLKGVRDQKLNKLIMQWLMGLMSKTEATARHSAKESKERLSDLKKDAEQKRGKLQTQFDVLAKSAGFDIPQFEASARPRFLVDLSDTVCAFVKGEARRVNEALETFEQESDDGLRTLKLRCQYQEQQATGAIRDASAARTRHQILVTQLKDEEKSEKGPTQCPARDQCAWLLEIQKNDKAGRMESEHLHLDRLRSEIEKAKESMETGEEKEKRLVAQHKQTQDEFDLRKSDVATRKAELQEQCGRWQALSVQASELTTATIEYSSAMDQVEVFQSRIEESKNQIASEEDDAKRKNDLQVLENCYSHVLTHIFDDEAEGRVTISGGLEPGTTATLNSHGTALSVMARVISFEFACVLASMCGLGHHPRLLMHDGPREGEMEPELFRIMFKAVEWLKSLSPESEPAFQYIVTTADAPEEFTENHPDVALVLDGRTAEGQLLRKGF